MRLAFMGTPDFAVPTLRALHAAGHDILAVYCQPPRPAGRGQQEQKSPVQRLAEELGLPVRTPLRLRKDAAAQAEFAALDLDAAVVVAYGQILPRAMLEAPRRGCLNIHGSLLPRWRGAAPIHAAILAGDTQTGVTIMRLEEGLDTGPMLKAAAVPIGPRATSGQLHDILAPLGAKLMLEVLAENPPAVPQPAEGITVCGKIGKEEGRLDWHRPAISLDRQLRACTPWPSCFFNHAGTTLRVLAAEPVAGGGAALTVLPGTVLPGTVLPGPALTVACGEGALHLTRLQRPGRGAMAAEDFLRGYPLPPGTVLG